jgi:hypothetical protein
MKKSAWMSSLVVMAASCPLFAFYRPGSNAADLPATPTVVAPLAASPALAETVVTTDDGSVEAAGALCAGCLGYAGQANGDHGPNGSIAVSANAYNGICEPFFCVPSPCEVSVLCDYALNGTECFRYSVIATSTVTGQSTTLQQGCVTGNGTITLSDMIGCGDKKTYKFKIAGMSASTNANCSACE